MLLFLFSFRLDMTFIFYVQYCTNPLQMLLIQRSHFEMALTDISSGFLKIIKVFFRSLKHYGPVCLGKINK